MSDPKYIADRDEAAKNYIEFLKLNTNSLSLPTFESGYDAGYSRANSELVTIKEDNQKLRQAFGVAVEVLERVSKEPDDYIKHHEKASEWLFSVRDALATIKTLIGETVE